MIITYSTKLTYENQDDKAKLLKILEFERILFNFCSDKHFGSKSNNIKELHSKCYGEIRRLYPEVKSQIIIKAENACLSAYRSVKSNKHKIDKPIQKKKLSIGLDREICLFDAMLLIISAVFEKILWRPKMSTFVIVCAN